MKRLLKVYLLNIYKQKGFYICLFINMFLIVLVPYLSTTLVKGDPTPLSTRIISIVSVGLIELIYITLFVCSDYTDGAAKNFISRGYTRRQILYAKFIASIVAVFSFFLINTLVTIIVFYKDGLGFDKSSILALLGAIIASIANIGLYVIIANTIEKMGSSMTTNILVYTFVPTIITLALNLSHANIDLLFYWIGNLPSLIPVKDASILDLLKVTGMTIGYLVLLFELSNYIIKRKEVK